jgi:hypothetical protein
VLSTTNRILIEEVLVTVLAGLALMAAAPSANPNDTDKHISVYSPVAIYSLPVLDHAGREYVGLLELLDPLGRVSSQSEGQHWKLRFNAIDAEFAAGKTRGRIGGHDIDFAAPFLVEDARGFIPIERAAQLAAALSGSPG